MLALKRNWLDRGIDGFRLDIFNFQFEANTFENNPLSLRFMPDPTITVLRFQRRLFTMNRPESFRFAEELRAVMDEYHPPRFTVGEVFGPS
jgi:glycosidase